MTGWRVSLPPLGMWINRMETSDYRNGSCEASHPIDSLLTPVTWNVKPHFSSSFETTFASTAAVLIRCEGNNRHSNHAMDGWCGSVLCIIFTVFFFVFLSFYYRHPSIIRRSKHVLTHTLPYNLVWVSIDPYISMSLSFLFLLSLLAFRFEI